MMGKVVLVIALFISISNAYVSNRSSCPKLYTDEKFVLSKFGEGKWYVYGRYPNEIQSDNIRSVYEGENLGNSYVLKTRDVPESSQDYREVLITLGDLNNNDDLTMVVTYGKPKETFLMKPKVLLSDLENYSVFYYCNKDSKTDTTHEYAWILVRAEKLEPKLKETIKDYVKKSEILDETKLLWFDSKFGSVDHELIAES